MLSRKLLQHQRSGDSRNCDGLNTDLGHWPIQETHKFYTVYYAVL